MCRSLMYRSSSYCPSFLIVQLTFTYHFMLRLWRRRAHCANVTNRHKTKTVEKFGKDSPTVFIYLFSGIPTSSYPRSLSNVRRKMSLKVQNASIPKIYTRQPFKAFYALIRCGCPVVHSSSQHYKRYDFIQLKTRNHGFYWKPVDFFRVSFIWTRCLSPNGTSC